jgi:hypothetical protein
VQAVATASDPDGDPVSLRYAWQIDSRRLLDTGARIQLPGNAINATVSVTVIATDGQDESPPTIGRFRAGNRAPRVTSLEIETVEIADRSARRPHWKVDAKVVDEDRNHTSVHYEWVVNGLVEAEGTDVFPQDHAKRGDSVMVRATPFDGQAHGPTLESPPVEIKNSVPEIVSSPPGLDASGEFRYAPEVHDRDKGDQLSYRLIEGPKGMEIDASSGLIVWKPNASNVGSHAVAFEVSDRFEGRSRQSFQVRVAVGGNPAPHPAAAPGPAAAR